MNFAVIISSLGLTIANQGQANIKDKVSFTMTHIIWELRFKVLVVANICHFLINMVQHRRIIGVKISDFEYDHHFFGKLVKKIKPTLKFLFFLY